MKKTAIGLFCLWIFLASCAPAVPYNQMPGGGGDLYSSASGNRMTADAALRQAQWQEDALTQTAQAPIIRITETAAAVQVQSTQAAGTTTAGVQTQAAALTATAILWTPSPIPTATPNLTATLDAIAIEAAQTQTTLLLEREEQNNEFNRLKGPIALVLAALMIVYGMIHITRRQRFRPLETDARGNVLPQLDIVEGTVTDMDRSPNFRASAKNDWKLRILAHWVKKNWGVELLLPEVTAKRQDDVTFRDQMTDLATRGLPAPSKSEDARKAKVGVMMTQPQLQAGPRVQVISPDMVRPILMDVMPQIAQDSIEAELYDVKKEDGAV
jgi:hypothetical protein